MNFLDKQMFGKVLDFLSRPFQKELKFFIVAFIISAIVDLFVFSFTASVFKAAFIGLHHYIICYFLTLILCLIPAFLKKLYKIIVFILLGINFIIDFVCIYSFHSVFSEYFTSIFANTNWNETVEFVKTYITPVHIIAFLSFFLLIYLFYYWKLKHLEITLNKRFSIIGVIIVFGGIICIGCTTTKNVLNISVMKFYSMFKDTPPDLKSYISDPDISISNKERPKNIVLIIGESFAKSHSSLYGYEKETNHYLTSLKDSGSLFVFNNVTSPEVTTVPAFKCIMSTYKPEYRDSIKWYECTTIHDVIRKVGYETFWFSNQNKNGLWDNVITQYAMLSDHVCFNGQKFAVKDKADLDGDLVNLIKKEGNLNDDNGNKMYFVHLMGSHYDFDKRYPKTFNKFNIDNYTEKDEKKRDLLSKYDNSVAYNDSVVYEMINLFKDKESVIIYFPDHGLDVYESRNDYIGHAIHDDKESFKAGAAIPFLVYTSDLFKMKYPLLYSRIKDNIDSKFRTDDIIYSIMDILGVRFNKNDDVVKYSLFS